MAEYIDREVFKKSVEEYYCKPCKADGKDHNGCWCRACWVDDMLDEIDCFQPAADVAPVRHGHLISTGMDELWAEFGNCTECGGDNYIKAEFCNWCGAKLA